MVSRKTQVKKAWAAQEQEWLVAMTPVDEEEERLRRLARDSLYEFFKQAWAVLEPGREYLDNWHVELLCEYLELVHEGEITKLLINIAPRSLKSRLVSIAFPCWVWLHKPNWRFLCLSYVGSLANDHNQDRRSLVKSDWYQGVAQSLPIREDKDRISEFANAEGGEMRSYGLEGGITGAGGECIICLPREAQVLTSAGHVAIGELVEKRSSLKVATFNHKSQQVEYQPILEWEKGPGRPMVEIDLGDRALVCTEDHPVYVEGKGYIKAMNIQPNDKVLISDEKELHLQ